ncbi:uncharacterized protein LOC130827062 [Amaranthus tricolor]|uniref:uncharacterized protein LOC130827062 n=1 Tax=Amaranthus tricolor TaxID=29722 RepID=UPI002590555C|nr:uncharacterized protein LOC130827062 [Amaranthus tricolor]
MAKFNEVQKRRRAQIAERKRAIHGDPNSKKLKKQNQPQSISGKRKRKLLKKWRRDQKDAIEKGLVNLDDVDMAPADGPIESKKTLCKFHLKKSAKLKIKLKHKKHKGKGQGDTSDLTIGTATVDTMVE